MLEATWSITEHLVRGAFLMAAVSATLYCAAGRGPPPVQTQVRWSRCGFQLPEASVDPGLDEAPVERFPREYSPEASTYEGLSELARWIREFTEANNCRLPDSLSEAQPDGFDEDPALFYLDDWGKPIVYEHQENGFELRSGGPDQVLRTQDDVVYVWRPWRVAGKAAEKREP